MKVLFVCDGNRQRSPTAARLFSRWDDVETESAGIRSDAEKILTAGQIERADLVIAMEDRQREYILREFGDVIGETPLVSLDIPDIYPADDPELIRKLENRAGPHIEEALK